MEVQIWKAERPNPLYFAGVDSRIHSCECVTNSPLAKPMIKRAAYKAPMLSVVCITTVAKTHSTHPAQRDVLRPKNEAVKPAVADVTKAPSVINDWISCCRSEVMFHPVGLCWSAYPKTFDTQVSLPRYGEAAVSAHLQERDHSLQPRDDAEIEAVLERTERHDSHCRQATPMVPKAEPLAIAVVCPHRFSPFSAPGPEDGRFLEQAECSTPSKQMKVRGDYKEIRGCQGPLVWL